VLIAPFLLYRFYQRRLRHSALFTKGGIGFKFLPVFIGAVGAASGNHPLFILSHSSPFIGVPTIVTNLVLAVVTFGSAAYSIPVVPTVPKLYFLCGVGYMLSHGCEKIERVDLAKIIIRVLPYRPKYLTKQNECDNSRSCAVYQYRVPDHPVSKTGYTPASRPGIEFCHYQSNLPFVQVKMDTVRCTR
jgi:hypothetical protein